MHAMLIGLAIWVVFLAGWGAVWWRRRQRLRAHPPSLDPQQVWDDASPEDQRAAARTFGVGFTGPSYGGGGGNSC